MGFHRIKASLGVLIVLALFLSVSLRVLPAYALEPSFTEILNNLGYTNVSTSTVQTFPPGVYNLTLYAEFTPYYGQNELSFYQVGTGNYTPILEGSEGGSGYVFPITKTFQADYQFGLSLSRNGSLPFRYFTESALNFCTYQFALVFNNLNSSGMLLIGFDDRTWSVGDLDYNDMVFSLQPEYYLKVVSPYDTASGGGWYYNGTTAFASVADSIVNGNNGTRRLFAQWSGDASGTNYAKSDPIIMTQNRTAVANWKTQYYLTVGTVPGGLVTISGQDWYDETQKVTLTAPTVMGYNFTYWDVDSVPQASGLNPLAVSMNGPHSATAHYARIFSLTITATSGGSLTPPPGVYTFPENSTVQVTATPNTNYALDHWELDGTTAGSANPYTVLMNANHTLKATFSVVVVVTISPMAASVQKGLIVPFKSVVSGGTQPYNYQWYLDGTPVSGAVSNSWGALITVLGVHSVYLKVTDSKNNVGQSDSASINVTAALSPVGGYSYSVAYSTKSIAPSAVYFPLVAALAVVITAIKRKRKRITR